MDVRLLPSAVLISALLVGCSTTSGDRIALETAITQSYEAMWIEPHTNLYDAQLACLGEEIARAPHHDRLRVVVGDLEEPSDLRDLPTGDILIHNLDKLQRRTELGGIIVISVRPDLPLPGIYDHYLGRTDGLVYLTGSLQATRGIEKSYLDVGLGWAQDGGSVAGGLSVGDRVDLITVRLRLETSKRVPIPGRAFAVQVAYRASRDRALDVSGHYAGVAASAAAGRVAGTATAHAAEAAIASAIYGLFADWFSVGAGCAAATGDEWLRTTEVLESARHHNARSELVESVAQRAPGIDRERRPESFLLRNRLPPGSDDINRAVVMQQRRELRAAPHHPPALRHIPSAGGSAVIANTSGFIYCFATGNGRAQRIRPTGVTYDNEAVGGRAYRVPAAQEPWLKHLCVLTTFDVYSELPTWLKSDQPVVGSSSQIGDAFKKLDPMAARLTF